MLSSISILPLHYVTLSSNNHLEMEDQKKSGGDKQSDIVTDDKSQTVVYHFKNDL